jgi:hypothetical protein
LVDEIPTDFRRIVIVRLPFATLICARLVKSQSTQPEAGERVRVERVISDEEHDILVFHVTEDSENPEQACAEIVVEDVPTTPVRYIFNSIDVGVIAVGQGISLRSNSMRI